MACVCILVLAACGGGKTAGGRIVSVTIEPQRYFAERIAGDKFAVHCVVPPGQSPETYDPTPRQMMQVGESEAYFRIGYIGFELAWMQNIEDNNPALKIFDLSEGIPLIEQDEEEDEAEETHHHHGGIDPHVWSSVSGAKVIAGNMLKAFVSLDPDNRAYYEENFQRLMGEIEATEQTIAQLLSPLKSRAFIIYHPALTYFAAENDLTQLCIEMEGKEPSPAQLRRLLETARAQRVHVVFIQQEFDQKNAELIAKETGCLLVPINPLAYDWSEEMIRIAKTLADGEAD